MSVNQSNKTEAGSCSKAELPCHEAMPDSGVLLHSLNHATAGIRLFFTLFVSAWAGWLGLKCFILFSSLRNNIPVRLFMIGLMLVIMGVGARILETIRLAKARGAGESTS
jgi:hypothetical protein